VQIGLLLRSDEQNDPGSAPTSIATLS
jgi:hypothetical protein